MKTDQLTTLLDGDYNIRIIITNGIPTLGSVHRLKPPNPPSNRAAMAKLLNIEKG